MIRYLPALLLVACTNAAPSPTGEQDGAPPSIAQDASPPAFWLHYSEPIGPGQESQVCALVAGPNAETWVSGWTASLKSVHHAGVSTIPKGSDFASKGCGVSVGRHLLFTVLTAQLDERIPVEGGALRIPADIDFLLDIHRLNTSLEVATATADIGFTIAETHAVEVFSGYADGQAIAVAPHTEQSVKFSCTVPQEVSFVSLLDHTHSRTKSVTASSNGKEIYRNTNWAEPRTIYYPPFSPGVFEWSCDIVNDTNSPLTYGISRDTGEMCQMYMLTLGNSWKCSK